MHLPNHRSILLVTVLALAAVPAHAGAIGLSWDPVPGASGYRVYYGTSSGQYPQSVDAGNTTAMDLDNLSDCTTYYVSVKAYNAQGESEDYSPEIIGWARPHVIERSTQVRQGDQLVLSLEGGNFDLGAELAVATNVPTDEYGAPLMLVESVSVVSCNRIEALVTIEPTALGLQAMPLGTFELDFEIVNPDGVYNTGSTALDVRFEESRADVNQNNERTTNRVDGDDLASLIRLWGSNPADAEFEYACDLDGDQEIDGDDLALLASQFGQCRSESGWSVEACL